MKGNRNRHETRIERLLEKVRPYLDIATEDALEELREIFRSYFRILDAEATSDVARAIAALLKIEARASVDLDLGVRAFAEEISERIDREFVHAEPPERRGVAPAPAPAPAEEPDPAVLELRLVDALDLVGLTSWVRSLPEETAWSESARNARASAAILADRIAGSVTRGGDR